MSEPLPPTEDLGVAPMPSKEEHMALLAGLKAPQDLGPVEGANPDLGPVEPVAPPPPDLTPTEPVSFTAYKAARGPAPDQAAQVLQLAKNRGVSPQWAADNADALRRQDEQDIVTDALSGAPVLAAYAGQSGVHASAVKDDVTVLQALEMGLADVGYGISARSYMDNPQAADESNLAAYEQAAANYAARKPGFVAEVVRAIPNVAAYGAASVLGSALGGPQGGSALGMGTALYQLNRGVLYRRIMEQVPTPQQRMLEADRDVPDAEYAQWQQEYADTQARAKDAAKKGALTGATIAAVLGDAFTRSLPFANAALQNIGQEIAAATLSKAALQRGTEFVGHTLSGALLMAEQAVVDNATVQKATTGSIDYGKAAEAGKDAFTEGLGVAAVLSAYTPGREFLRDVGRLREAPQDVARLDKLVDQAKASKLIQRAPAEAEQLLGQMAAQGDAHTVYVDAEAAQRPEVAAKLVEALADEGRALAEAQATGGDVAVPTEKYLSTLADQHEALREDVKLNPEGMTLNQVKEWQEAWHGTPHQFATFDLSHVGEGQGARSFGHGLYFAEEKAVAETYRQLLSEEPDIASVRTPLSAGLLDQMRAIAATSQTEDAARLIERTRSILEDSIASSEGTRRQLEARGNVGEGPTPEEFDRYVADARARLVELKNLSPADLRVTGKGNTYRVAVPHGDVLLDWDKPLSEQPAKVKSALNVLLERMPVTTMEIGPGLVDVRLRGMSIGTFPPDRIETVKENLANHVPWAGGTLYQALTRDYFASRGVPGTDAAGMVSDDLRAAGIPGVRYLDQGSRPNGEGTHNFVIWDNRAIRMLQPGEEVNPKPAPAVQRQPAPVLNAEVSKLLAERTVLDQQPESPEKRAALANLHQRMRDVVAQQYRANPQEYAQAYLNRPEGPPSSDAMAWARKLTDERTISELQPGRYELAAKRAADKLAQIATESAQKGQEAARQGFLGAGMQAQEGAAGEAGVANLRQAGTKADAAAKKLAQVPQLERARDLARAQATVQTEVKAEMDKGREYLAKRDTDRYRSELAKAAPEYLDFFNTVQEAVDDNTPRATPNPQALDALLLRVDHDAEPVGGWAEALRPILENPQGWNKLTPPEARSVVDAIKNIRGAARRQNEITLADRKATLREMVGEARSYLDSTNRPDSGPPAPSRASEGFGERFAKGAEAIHTELLQPIRILRDRLGALGNYIADAYVKARNGKEELSRQVGDEVSRFYEKLPKELKTTRFDGVDGPGSPVFSDKWTRQDLWEFASWWGSESGSDRIKKGLRVTDAQAHEFMSQLTGAEADFLEAKWKLNDEKLWPLVRDHERALMGTAPAKIEARPFTIRTAEGDVRELRGGYEPARYRTDAESTAKAPEDAQSISEYWGTLRDGFESTAKYFTKERAQNVARVPDLNWGMYSGHVNSVLHYLAFDEFVRNTGRIFRDTEFRELVQRRLGAQDMKELDKFLGVAARGRVESAQDGAGELGRIVGGGFRSRVGTAAFQLNPRIIAGQLSHFAAAIPALKLGPADILYGLSQAFRPGTWGAAFDGSEQLPYRWNGFGQKMREQLVGIGPGDKPLTRKWLDAAGWSGYHVMDGFLSKAIFEAASSKAERAGADPVASRQAGDRAVELMMPPLNLAEQSSFARDRGVIGSLILVRNFPNTLYNIGAKLEWDARNQVMASDPGWQRAATALGAYGAAGASYLGTVWAAHILGRFLMGHGRQPDESSKEWLEREALSAPFYPVPFAGEAASVLAESAVTHKTLKSIVTTRGVIAQAPALAEVERAIRDLGTAISAGTGTEDRVFAGLRLAANVLNVPSEPLRGVQYGYDLWSGRARPRGAFDAASGFAYGKRRKQAKNPATLTQDFLSGD